MLETALQAGSWLDSMGAACAIEADWSAEALRYIRKDDCVDPDCGLLLERLTVCQDRVTKLFIEGRVLFDRHYDDSPPGSPPLYYGRKVKRVWTEEEANYCSWTD